MRDEGKILQTDLYIFSDKNDTNSFYDDYMKYCLNACSAKIDLLFRSKLYIV